MIHVFKIKSGIQGQASFLKVDWVRRQAYECEIGQIRTKYDHESVVQPSNLSIIRVDNKKQNGLMVLVMVVLVDIECSFTFRFRFISDRLIIMRF